MHKNAPTHIEDQAFNDRASISVVDILTEFKRAYDSSRIVEGTTVWLFREFMNAPALAAVRLQLTVSSNNPN